MGRRPSRWMAHPLEAWAALTARQLFEHATANPHLPWRAVAALVDPNVERLGFVPEIVRAAVLRYCMAVGEPFPRRKR